MCLSVRPSAALYIHTSNRAVIIDASGVSDVDLSALAVIDEVVSEMAKQEVDVFLASASLRVVKSLDAYDLVNELGGESLVQLDVEDVFWAVLEDLGVEDGLALAAEKAPNKG